MAHKHIFYLFIYCINFKNNKDISIFRSRSAIQVAYSTPEASRNINPLANMFSDDNIKLFIIII